MQSVPLSIPMIFHRAEQISGMKRITTAEAGAVRHTTVAEWAVRVRRLAAALDALDVPARARVATFAWNTDRHLELYFAVPCADRVLHPLNIRMSAEQLRHVIEEAQDDVIVVELSLLERIWPLAERLDRIRHWVVIDDGSGADRPDDDRIIDYEELLSSVEPFSGRFSVEDETSAASICHTSGTTGNPKGVVYSHRSTVLHSLGGMAAGLVGISERDTVMPIVPMFHANGWGLPYTALFAGADLVLPGSDLSPRSLLRLVEDHRVSVMAAVPAIWSGMLPQLEEADLSSLRIVLGGGSATPPPLAAEWERRVGVPIMHTWGMTELNPTGAIGGLRSYHDGVSQAEREKVLARQGQPALFVELRVADVDSGLLLPHDDVSTGELQAHGPTVAAAYLGDVGHELLTDDGWLRTGDIASIDEFGYVTIHDRIKDLIKSGGEWIPSIDLENAICALPSVAEAAVVARPDPKWLERPVAFVVMQRGESGSAQSILDELRNRVPKWWLPDEIRFIDALPRNTTGKVAKDVLRTLATSPNRG
ncbi:long-chain-fatty-acid--CoA ligase [Homoserinimonas aerilata]|nr:long-chain-fatty-acid--CoA ligase [Homoserinimonas aerilata]